jgi:chaperonin GroEL
MLEKKDRVDDALHATKAALDEGIVPGGGCSLLYASSGIKADSIGAQIVVESCAKPFSQILINAGYDDVKTKILADQLVNSGNDHWAGIDVNTGDTVNFREKGVIDPTKVSRLALLNAASVAGTVLLTECTLTQDKESIEQKLRVLQDSATNAAGLAMS